MSCDPALNLALAFALFLATAGELSLTVCKVSEAARPRIWLPDAALTAGALLLLSWMGAGTVPGASPARVSPLWLLTLTAASGLGIHAGLGWRSVWRRSRDALSPASVQAALDNLDSGVCFFDAQGRVLLINHTMGDLSSQLIGGWPRDPAQLLQALRAGSNGVARLDGRAELYRFPDGRIWRFSFAALRQPGLEGCTQITAQNVTALWTANEELRRDNEALRKTNEETRRMYDRLADRIREQETLSLKMRIHNEIGASLIALSELMERDEGADAELQLARLREAVNYFRDEGDRSVPPDTLEDACRQAEEMSVRLEIQGWLPRGGTAEELVTAAARECVTNCVRHARGSLVRLCLSEHGGILRAEFTNDGLPPEGPIIPGGGLSALRKRVEQEGGELRLAHSPRFALILNLPLGENGPRETMGGDTK